MGYYTKYDLLWERLSNPVVGKEDFSGMEKKIREKLTEVNPGYFDPADHCYPDTLDPYFWEPMKWYDAERDMIEVSRAFPGILFELRGHGEDEDDMWVEYFYEGGRQKEYAQIIYRDFDPDLLIKEGDS